MGRKKKEKVGSFDRIGEEVNLEKCPECVEHPDCFAWMDGRCTALKESGCRGCVFLLPPGIVRRKRGFYGYCHH